MAKSITKWSTRNFLSCYLVYKLYIFISMNLLKLTNRIRILHTKFFLHEI